MEVFFFEPVKYAALYNCSFYDYRTIPLKERKHVALGTVIILSYITFVILYVLCMYAMFQTNHRSRASYRLMILLGIIHIAGLQFAGLSTGVLAIIGAVFCTSPTLIYICGQFAVATWCGSTLCNMILCFNRCTELYGGGLSQRVFGGKRLWIWLMLPNLYIAYIFIFTPPVIFSGMMMTWFFNPHAGYVNDLGKVYHNNLHSTNNFIVCTTEFMLYACLILLYLRATRSSTQEIKQAFRREKKIYIQVVLIGIIHFIASFSYVLMQFVEVDFYATLLASTFYLLSQGFPPVIYLTVNKTIRNIVLSKVGLRKLHNSNTVPLTGQSGHTAQSGHATQVPTISPETRTFSISQPITQNNPNFHSN